MYSLELPCFEQKYEKYQFFLSENFQFLEVKFSIYLNRHVFIKFFLISSQKHIVWYALEVPH